MQIMILIHSYFILILIYLHLLYDLYQIYVMYFMDYYYYYFDYYHYYYYHIEYHFNQQIIYFEFFNLIYIQNNHFMLLLHHL